MVNSARLTLGFMYFELSSYKTSIKYLADITPDFFDYPSALLTIGWSAFKLQDYQRAISSLTDLVQDYPQYQNLEEAHFVLGHCYLRLGYHDFAIREYDKIIAATPGVEEYSILVQQINDSLAQTEIDLTTLKTEFAALQKKLVADLAVRHANGSMDSTLAVRFANARLTRDALLQPVLQQSKLVARAIQALADLQSKLQKADVQKKWRSYAEYGRVRALYLKGIGTR